LLHQRSKYAFLLALLLKKSLLVLGILYRS
ncbi:MAG: hypothetical protein ACI9IZ_001681, partial [Nonlabens sp.]